MHDIRLLFDAMDEDGFIALYVTAATCFTVIVLFQLAQLAWSYLEPHLFRLLRGKESAREVPGFSHPASPQRTVPGSARDVGRVAAGPRKKDLADRISRRRLEVADQRRPMWL